MTQSAGKRAKRAQKIFDKAVAAHRAGRLDEALGGYAEAVERNPQSSQAYNNMGVALRAQGAFHAAVASYRRAIAIKSDDAGSHSNLGNALRALGRHSAAEASHRQALALDENYLEARYNLGLVLKDQGLFEEGIACLREAVRRKADYVDAHWDLALALLMMGDLKEGFDEYEWRWRLPENSPRKFDKPAWNGDALDGRTILLHAEQGMGDSIQFARYAPLVAERGGEVMLECQRPLAPLFENLAGVGRVIAREDALPEFDLHAPLLSLPRIFETVLETIPVSDAYLAAEPARVAKFDGLLDPKRLISASPGRASRATATTATGAPAWRRLSIFSARPVPPFIVCKSDRAPRISRPWAAPASFATTPLSCKISPTRRRWSRASIW